MAGSFLGESRECVGEGMGMGGNRFGPGNRFPTEKPGDPGKNNPHVISGTPEPPPPGGGRGRSRTASTNRESIPGKTTALSRWSRTELPSEEEMTGKSREIPSQKFTIPPRLVNGFPASYCKPARKKFPKNLDKGGLRLYLCRWKTGALASQP